MPARICVGAPDTRVFLRVGGVTVNISGRQARGHLALLTSPCAGRFYPQGHRDPSPAGAAQDSPAQPALSEAEG